MVQWAVASLLLVAAYVRGAAPGPPPMPVTETIALTAEVLGARFDGIGAISGGGATSKLLMK